MQRPIMKGGENMTNIEFQDIQDSAIIYVMIEDSNNEEFETIIYKRKLLSNETYTHIFKKYNECINRYYTIIDELEVFEELKELMNHNGIVWIDCFEDCKVLYDEYNNFKSVSNK
jgi:mevalonate kinase